MSKKKDHSIIKPWYAEIRKQLKSHFRNVDSMQQAATQKSEVDGKFIEGVNHLISENISRESFSVEELAKEMAMSRSQVFRRIKAITQMSPIQYIRFVRLHKAKDLLETGQHNVGEVASEMGFASLSHFTRVFKDLFGFNPSSLKK